jgi:hypothetical protein
MAADSFREQSLYVRQRKDLFCKSVKLGFAQILCPRCNALNGSTTGDKPVRPLAPFSLCIVGGAVFKALDYVLFLYKLAFNFLFLGLQLFDFFFVHNLNLPTDIKMDRKRPPTFSVDGLTYGMGFSDFAVGMVCASRLFPQQSALG